MIGFSQIKKFLILKVTGFTTDEWVKYFDSLRTIDPLLHNSGNKYINLDVKADNYLYPNLLRLLAN